MVIISDQNFGYSVYGESVGESWISALQCVVERGETTFDEGRKRLSLQNFRLKAEFYSSDDAVIHQHGNSENIDKILELTFSQPKMTDIDVNPSFDPGAKSYYARLQEGRLLEFAAQRLSTIPESKKAAIVFPTYDDYLSVLEHPWNDYLPCIVSVQFRMIPAGGRGRYSINSIFFARSLDIFQKGLGNIIAIAKMADIVAESIRARTGREITLGFIEGFITDIHVYEESISQAEATLDAAKIKYAAKSGHSQ